MVDQGHIEPRVPGRARLIGEMLVGTTRLPDIGWEQQHHAWMMPAHPVQIHMIIQARTARQIRTRVWEAAAGNRYVSASTHACPGKASGSANQRPATTSRS